MGHYLLIWRNFDKAIFRSEEIYDLQVRDSHHILGHQVRRQ